MASTRNSQSTNVVVVYVPEYVHLSSINQCIQDRNAIFVSVRKQSLDIDAARRQHGRIVVLERDHFVFYIDPYPDPFRCCYQSRNLVMTDLRYLHPFPPMFFNYWPLVLRDGLWSANQPPRLFFVNTNDRDYIQSSSADAHTIVEYYAASDDAAADSLLDFDRFASIARKKTACVMHFFVVKVGHAFIAVDTNNAASRYTFSAAIKHRVVRDLSTKTESVQSLAAASRRLQARRAEMLPQPGFQLRDSDGRVLDENDSFRLRIIRHPSRTVIISDANANADGNAAVDAGNSDAHERLCATSFGPARKKTVIHGSAAEGAVFRAKTINGIVYLALDNDYVTIPQRQTDDLTTSPRIPDKDQRIQIHYDKSGYIMLSRWNDCVFAQCEWFSDSYAAITFVSDDYRLHYGTPALFKIERCG
ncbi:hypothetical protein H4R99_008098 [Coemansia sp. RSA 1722]|nr:hypothetical protein IWW45_007776 [Coemansia sp. RSA 485]KAJ2587579.1 hypothetical protein H4R99_008098 [Coemansia sp. RSA 1722]